MNKYFKKFRETGKVSDYLKYREEIAKEENRVVKNEHNKSQRNRNQKY